MKTTLEKMNIFLKKIVEIIKADGLILGVLVAIYHGIYNLNKTVSNLVKSLPIVENNMKFADISIDFDIALAEKQLMEKGYIDRILIKKLLLYKKDLKLTSAQIANINYLETKTSY